jgi:hypothetical protein
MHMRISLVLLFFMLVVPAWKVQGQTQWENWINKDTLWTVKATTDKFHIEADRFRDNVTITVSQLKLVEDPGKHRQFLNFHVSPTDKVLVKEGWLLWFDRVGKAEGDDGSGRWVEMKTQPKGKTFLPELFKIISGFKEPVQAQLRIWFANELLEFEKQK